MSYDDNVLIKLKRQYTENEALQFALKTISELKVELGKSNAFIIELQESPVNKEMQKTIIELRRKLEKIKNKPNHEVNNLKREINNLKEKAVKVDKLTAYNTSLRNEIRNLKNQLK